MITKTQSVLLVLILVSAACIFIFCNGVNILNTGSTTSITNYIMSISLLPELASSNKHVYNAGVDYKKFLKCAARTTLKRTAENLTEVITSCQDFSSRVREYNIALNIIRNQTMRTRKPEDWHGAEEGTTVGIAWGANDDFLQQLGRDPDITTVVLPWLGTRSSNWSSLSDKSNLLLQNYYEWTASDMLCKWIETSGTIKLKYDVTFNRTCNRFINNTITPSSLKPIFLHMKPLHSTLYWSNNGASFPTYFYQNTTPYVFYLHVVPDAIVTEMGDVYGRRVKIVPYTCSANRDPKVPMNVKSSPLYDEVFVIAQHWGHTVFHRMGEVVPRLAGWLHFLEQNPHIKIFSIEGKGGRLGEILRILGIDPDRLVTKLARAKVAYVPRGTFCGNPSVQESQIISSIYRSQVEKVLGAQSRNKLVLIRRTGQRHLTEQLEIERVLQSLAKEYGLVFEMFIDNPVPSLNHTMRMFHSAVMVVAPHGAGLANIYFSQPGTYVIEGVCNLPHVNLCFQRLAVILGHHWHGIPSRGGCEGVVDISAKDLETTAKAYLQNVKRYKQN